MSSECLFQDKIKMPDHCDFLVACFRIIELVVLFELVKYINFKTLQNFVIF